MHRAVAVILLLLFLAFGVRIDRFGLRPVQLSLVIDLHGVDLHRFAPVIDGTQAPGEIRTPAPGQAANQAETPASPVPTGSPAAANAKPEKANAAVSLDIAQISRDGTSVFAGKSAPFAHVTVLDGTTEVATATALANGDWSVATDHKFDGHDPHINLKIADSSGNKADAPAVHDAVPQDSAPASQRHTTAANEAGIGAQTGAIGAASPSPSAKLMREFEGVVATAREEAKHRIDEAGSHDVARELSPSPKPSTAMALADTSPQKRVELAAPAEVASGAAALPSVTTAVPITFLYNEPALTSDGQGAARLLLEYVNLKRFGTIALSGHADERGSHAYNVELSRQRLLTIEHVLRDGGYKGRIELLPKGSSEPFTGIVRSQFAREELMQLDRRVELRVAK